MTALRECLRKAVAAVNGPLFTDKSNEQAGWAAVSFLQSHGTELLSILDAEGDSGAVDGEAIAWLTPGGDVSRSWSWCSERCQPGQKPVPLYTPPQPVRSGVVSDEQVDGDDMAESYVCLKCGHQPTKRELIAKSCPNCDAHAPTAEPVAQGEADQTTPFNEWWDAHRTAYAVNGSMKGLAIMAWQASRTFYAAQPASPEQPAGRQGEAVAWRFLGLDGSPVTEWDDMPVRHGVSPGLLCPPIASVQYAYLHPAAPVGVPDAWPKLELWFFRELVEAQRLKLFALHGMPVDEIGASHIHQKRALRQLLAAAPSAPQEVES